MFFCFILLPSIMYYLNKSYLKNYKFLLVFLILIHDLQMQKKNKFKILMRQDVIFFLIKLSNQKIIIFINIVEGAIRSMFLYAGLCKWYFVKSNQSWKKPIHIFKLANKFSCSEMSVSALTIWEKLSVLSSHACLWNWSGRTDKMLI